MAESTNFQRTLKLFVSTRLIHLLRGVRADPATETGNVDSEEVHTSTLNHISYGLVLAVATEYLWCAEN